MYLLHEYVVGLGTIVEVVLTSRKQMRQTGAIFLAPSSWSNIGMRSIKFESVAHNNVVMEL